MKFFKQYTCLLCVISSLIACYSLAHAEDITVAEQPFLQDFPVVLSASRLSQPLSESPNAITVIDRNMIKASGFRNIADLFRLVPGMYVGELYSHTPIVAYHGSTEEFSRRMQVLIDGRSVYLPPISMVDWEDIPLEMDDIERVEVVRGPAAASYGANSLHGVINIITRDAGSVHGADVKLTSGAVGVADIAAHLGRVGENLDYRFTFAHREDKGYGSNVLRDAKFTNQANMRASYHPLGSNSFDIQLGFSDSIRGLGIAGKLEEPFRNAKANSAFQQLNWLHAQENGDEVKLSYYHINRSVVDESFGSLNAGGFVAAQTAADRHDIELQQTMQLGKRNRLVWGAGWRTDYADSPENIVIPYTFRQTRIFAHDEWRFSAAGLLNAGAMIEDDGLGHTNTSPRLSLNYHVTPQHTLRISTSVAYRTPSIYEEKFNIHGATYGQIGTYISMGGLQPEKTRSREIGYLGEFQSMGLTLDVRAYNDLVSDIIFVDPAATVSGWPFGFANLYSANYHGYEGTLKYRWSDSGNVIFNMARQFARCEITGTASNPLYVSAYLQGYIDDCPLSVPDYSGSILLTQKLVHDVQISAGYYHQGILKMIAGVPQTTMNRVDLRMAKTFGTRGKIGSGEIALVVQNAFLDDYSKHSITVETDNMIYSRRTYISATLNF